jgi:HSP20 family protein
MRRFTMPADADEAKVDATFKDGMLNVTIAKSKAKAPKAKEIAVH